MQQAQQYDWIAEEVITLDDYRAGRAEARSVREDRVIEEAMQILERRLMSRHVGEAFTSSAETKHYLKLRLAERKSEVFMVLFFDNRHRLLSFEEMFHGTVDGTSVHPREVVRRSLELNAAAVVFAHNHPSGVCEPSMADERITSRLKEALSLVDVRVLDHIIVGEGEPVSFAERCLI